jgi:hypothetical protein
VVGRGGQVSFVLLGLRVFSLVWAVFERAKLVARGRPALPRCADDECGDKMIDRVLVPCAFAVARSLEALSRATGRWRQAPFGSRPQTSS